MSHLSRPWYYVVMETPKEHKTPDYCKRDRCADLEMFESGMVGCVGCPHLDQERWENTPVKAGPSCGYEGFESGLP